MKADLKHVVGSRSHRSVMVGRGGVAEMPEPVAVRVVRDGAGFSLLRIDKLGVSISHTWHPTLDDAKQTAANEYGVTEEDWRDT